MNGYLSDRVRVTLIYLPFQSPANRSLRVPTVSLKRPTKTKQAPNADGFPSWEESVGFCEERAGDEAVFRYQEAIRGHGRGRPGWLPTPAPLRSGLAHHAHSVPHLMNFLARGQAEFLVNQKLDLAQPLSPVYANIVHHAMPGRAKGTFLNVATRCPVCGEPGEGKGGRHPFPPDSSPVSCH